MSTTTDSRDFTSFTALDAGTATTTTVSATAPTYTIDQIADYVRSGYWGGERHFNVTSGGSLTYDVSTLTAMGQNLAREALSAWSAVTGITFVEQVGGSVDIQFDDEDSGAYSTFSYSGTTILSSYVNINKTWDGGDPAIDSYNFQTYLHEIGHALGLGHAGPYNGSATYGTDNLYANDSWQMSVMSYFHQVENTAITADFAYVITPMIADILAMQALYGTPATQSGNTVYGEGGNTGTYLDSWLTLTQPVTLTLLDSGGTDRIDLGSQTYAQRIDLTPESISDVQGLIGNLIIARGTIIEDVTTGSGNDTVTGNAADNTFRLGGGADFAQGGTGFDWIEGGAGNDSLYGGAQADNLLGGDGNDVLRGEDGNDRLTGDAGADDLMGGAGDDKLWGGAGNDTLAGGDNDDIHYGAGGNDWIDCGDGNDWADGGAQEDSILGGSGNDTLYGGAGFDTLDGGADDDWLDGGNQADNLYGGLGADTLTGGQGADRLFGGDGADQLLGGTENDALFGEAGDDLMDGEAGNDRLFGGLGNDSVSGGGGNDTLYGNAGFDTLIGGAGDDTLYGGYNADLFVFSDGSGNDVIADFDATNLYELIDLSLMSAILDWADLSANHLSSDASNCYIDAGGGDYITLLGVGLVDLDAGDFLFA